ncbi:tyrosine-protein phosphatase [Persicitalea sp.]|uniref:tyrosine-protein phosphatase n=1 Tax=Persicitalea sp. TaxID=3100273 RepID=UPI003593C543
MFSIPSFFKKGATVSALRDLKVDMHSHLIPGIDDGSPDIATSLELLRGLWQVGYEKIIITPHIYRDLYPNDSESIKVGLKALTDAMEEQGIEITVEAAAEYYIDRHFESLIESDDVLSFGKKRYVLIEMSFVSISPNLENVVFSLVARGYQPILAHPERYNYLTNQLVFYRRLTNLGCLLQINLLSLVGYYGKSVQNWALALLKAGLISFLGTDLHHRQHLALLTDHQMDRRLTETICKYSFKNQELLE